MFACPVLIIQILIICLQRIFIESIIVERNMHSYYRVPVHLIETCRKGNNTKKAQFYILQCPSKTTNNIPKPKDMQICAVVGNFQHNTDRNEMNLLLQPRGILHTHVDYKLKQPLVKTSASIKQMHPSKLIVRWSPMKNNKKWLGRHKVTVEPLKHWKFKEISVIRELPPQNLREGKLAGLSFEDLDWRNRGYDYLPQQASKDLSGAQKIKNVVNEETFGTLNSVDNAAYKYFDRSNENDKSASEEEEEEKQPIFCADEFLFESSESFEKQKPDEFLIKTVDDRAFNSGDDKSTTSSLEKVDKENNVLKYLGVKDAVTQKFKAKSKKFIKIPLPNKSDINSSDRQTAEFFMAHKQFQKGDQQKGFHNIYHRDEIYHDHIFYDDLDERGSYKTRKKAHKGF